jgi:two-component sensor histidine kinase
VSTLNDLVRSRTDISEVDLDGLHVLLGEWQILADLSFADLLLWLPTRGGSGFVVAAQLRPTTGPTVLPEDLVGHEAGREELATVAAATSGGGFLAAPAHEVGTAVDAIPVRRAGRVIGAIERHCPPGRSRPGSSALEEAYLASADELARMIAEGRFPFPAMFSDPESAPRVGDGFIRLDADGAVEFASPNALSAYRRLGWSGDLVGADLSDITISLAPDGPMDDSLAAVARGRAPRTAEVEANGSHVLLRAIPVQPGGRRTGALVLLRDVTDLRRRDRLMASKDATIREVHHRVKNNLQTVAALLRLQARRLDSPAARSALDEAVRRVGSIAIVHETLSQTPDEVVAFDDIADRLLEMVVDVGTDGEMPPIASRRSGTFGVLTAQVATPLAMALTEVLQNAVEHGLGERGGRITVNAGRGAGRLRVEVVDDGAGLPANFDAQESGRLGLQIVRTLVIGELRGTFDLALGRGGGTRAVIDVPLAPNP